MNFFNYSFVGNLTFVGHCFTRGARKIMSLELSRFLIACFF